MNSSGYRENLLCIAPPYTANLPPAGSAFLLGYLEGNGCTDFDFLDLRLGAPDVYSPTYSSTGAFGETYVMDVPDLPLVLSAITEWERGRPPLEAIGSDRFEAYCFERAMSPTYLKNFIESLDHYLSLSLAEIPQLDFVGFSVWTSNYLATLMACIHLKRRKRPPCIVLGGPHVTESRVAAKLALQAGLADAVALGEGEVTFFDLYRSFRADGALAAVPGSLVRGSKGEVQEGKARSLLALKDLPIPRFERMNLPAYETEGLRCIPFQLSRGCTDKCSFCSEWTFWSRFRLDSTEHTVRQVEELNDRYEPDCICFSDSLLNGTPRRLEAFADQLLSRGIDITWTGFMRANMDERLASLLYRAGCSNVFVGIESFNDETLELMNKRRTEAENIQALDAFLGAGIGVVAGCIPGFPGDAREGFQKTVLRLREIQKKYPGQLAINVEPFIVSPGQPMFQNLADYGLTGSKWADNVLEIAPEHRETAAAAICSVAGSGQGMERSGRLQIANAITTDAAVAKGVFDYDEVEYVTPESFTFEHLTGGWHAASRKTDFGGLYTLIVDESEKEILEALDFDWPSDSLSSSRLRGTVRRLEARHLVGPAREGPRVSRAMYLYGEINPDQVELALAPTIIAREIGRKGRRQLAIYNVASFQWTCRPVSEAAILDVLRRKPRRMSELRHLLRRRGVEWSIKQIESRLYELHAFGAVMASERSGSAASHSRRLKHAIGLEAQPGC